MNTDIEVRVVNAGNYIVENKATVRATAKVFGVSKSTIHTEGVILKLFTRYILTYFDINLV